VQKVFLRHGYVCKHFSSYQDYTNYRWDLIR
jgi:hypothetical protein